jgi:flagellar protein FlaG
MSTIVQMTTVPADLMAAQAMMQPKRTDKDQKKVKPPAPPQAQAEAADSRLVIREGVEHGIVVYTVLDRISGKVMAQLPREDVAQLASRPDYSAGQVVDTRV